MFRLPFEPDALALLLERLLRGRLEVLPDDDELPAGVEVDEVPRDHAHVDDLAHDPGLAFTAVVLAHVDLLGTDRDAPGIPFEDVRDTDEAGDELGLWMLVDVGRRTDLLDAPLVEDGEAVAHRERLFLVVGDVDERDAEVALERLQKTLHLLPQLQVERAERLVEEEDRGGGGERTRASHT